ncbi:hypothetical protein OIU79_014413, partial [Salix purpurea]
MDINSMQCQKETFFLIRCRWLRRILINN